MPTKKWNVSLAGTEHEIILKHGPIPGREIWLDGKLIEKGRVMPDIGSEHHFTLDGQPVELGIVSTLTGFDYYLLINQQHYFPVGDRKNSPGKFVTTKLQAREYWQQLARTLGFEYLPVKVKQFVYQPRLIGFYKNYLVLIQPGFKQIASSAIPGLFVIIRHAAVSAEQAKAIKKDEKLMTSLRELKFTPDMQIFETVSTFFIFDRNTKDKANMAEKISLLISAITPLLQPQPAERCQGTDCKQPNWQDLKFTFINDIPSLLCASCISEIDNQSKKFREEYKKAPSNLLKGILYGSAGAMIGAVAWALAFVFFDRIGAAFAMLTVFLVYKAMDKAVTKPGLISSLSAGVIALGGGVLGTYLGILGYLLKERQAILTLPLLSRVAQVMMDEPELLRETLLFSLLGIVP